MNKFYQIDYDSPIGVIEIIATNEAVYSILFSDREEPENHVQEDTPMVLKDCFNQIDDYFKGICQEFTFPFIFDGTDFQKTVWNALTTINYADTCSYKDIGKVIGNEKASRAIGSANGKNKLSIVIPCHRVIGSNGTLTGYAGGVWRKEWLLCHEKSMQGSQLHSR
ncbi:methylated-DNA--[protein]-cysteine S-methyltransferase [Sporosarcina limicola]|uniref:Methylated-DNA--protein-cysteine methyltransferase n=1 Tax=Sporosarcina limicola TaxID=34101 RepID=A0A927MKI4_9BACL|nr:methylated-DNA--[protein]-cysteine S-methyltransferase [Sporosarcina limicola]MBE1556400.1 methylated-DNA-[protein]-cysteine S-methyltransferase [Sporosarcina limicola]